MNRLDCADCICICVDKQGNWVCDEVDKEIQDIKQCPEESKKNE
jgi:hypothetical protein